MMSRFFCWLLGGHDLYKTYDYDDKGRVTRIYTACLHCPFESNGWKL